MAEDKSIQRIFTRSVLFNCMPILVNYRNNLSRNYSVYQSPVPVFYSGDKQIQLSEIEQEHYQTLF